MHLLHLHNLKVLVAKRKLKKKNRIVALEKQHRLHFLEHMFGLNENYFKLKTQSELKPFDSYGCEYLECKCLS